MSGRDIYRDGHGFRPFSTPSGKPPRPKAPEPKMQLVVCRVSVLEVTDFTDGTDAVNAFYGAPNYPDLVFVALYGGDGKMVNNLFRSGAR